MAVLQFPPHSSSQASVRKTVEFDDDDLRRLIDAAEHFEAYLHSQQRDESSFRELLMRLRASLGKKM